MPKSILISINPEFVEKILNHTKTIEIRKTKPKCELPCKVYIYCTKGKKLYKCVSNFDEDLLNGKVVAEFTLNKIDKFDSAYSEWAYSVAPEDSEMPISETQFIQMAEQKGKLDCNYLLKYFGDEDYIAYAWHIDNLKVYDKPKELSEFSIGKAKIACGYGNYNICNKILKRPPQSWMFVDNLEE